MQSSNKLCAFYLLGFLSNCLSIERFLSINNLFLFSQKKDEEIKELKEKLENLNKNFDNLESEIKRVNNLISQVTLFAFTM